MRQYFPHRARCALAVFPIFLAACGGGGGGGVNPERSLTFVPSERAPTISTLSTATITVTGPRADPTAVTVAIGGVSITFDGAAGDTINPEGGGAFQFFQKADDSAEGVIDIQQEFVTNARMRTEQGWEVGEFDGGSVFVGVDGTVADTRPVSDVLEYTGQSIGYIKLTDQGLGTTRSDIVITADFATSEGTFTSTNSVVFTEVSGVDDELFWLDVTGAITIDGGTYSGSVVGTGIGRFQETEGTVGGSFYGPESTEAGGTLEYINSGLGFRGIASFSATGTPVP